MVTGIADGIPIPLRLVPDSGVIPLDRPASKVVVGLPFTPQLQSVYLDTGNPTIQGQRKDIPAVVVRVEASCGFQVGANQVDSAARNPQPSFSDWGTLAAAKNPLPPYTSTGGGQVSPLLQVLAFVPEVLPGDLPEIALSQRAPRTQSRAV